jgi:hypothetical protein
MNDRNEMMIPEEVIMSKIYLIRGEKVMLDRDLAKLYEVETRILNQAVRRNEKRFPADFMFQMSKVEMDDWKSQIVISNSEKMGLRKPPLVFTEQGVAMLSSVLNSDRAIMVNIQIIRVFTKIRRLLETHSEILRKLESIEKKEIEYDQQIILIFKYLRQLEQSRQQQEDQVRRKRIGFRKEAED